MRRPRRRCMAKDCHVYIPHGLLMCSQHWLQLPRDMRDALLTKWNFGTPQRGYRAKLIEALRFHAERKEELHG